jgi:hypothetical protein
MKWHEKATKQHEGPRRKGSLGGHVVAVAGRQQQKSHENYLHQDFGTQIAHPVSACRGAGTEKGSFGAGSGEAHSRKRKTLHFSDLLAELLRKEAPWNLEEAS